MCIAWQNPTLTNSGLKWYWPLWATDAAQQPFPPPPPPVIMILCSAAKHDWNHAWKLLYEQLSTVSLDQCSSKCLRSILSRLHFPLEKKAWHYYFFITEISLERFQFLVRVILTHIAGWEPCALLCCISSNVFFTFMSTFFLLVFLYSLGYFRFRAASCWVRNGNMNKTLLNTALYLFHIQADDAHNTMVCCWHPTVIREREQLYN